MTEMAAEVALLDRADALTHRLLERRRLAGLLGQLQGFETQLSIVDAARDRVQALLALSATFSKLKIHDESPLSEARNALAPLRQLRSDFSSEPISILGARRLSAITVNVKSATEALSAKLLATWSTYARSLIPSVNDEMLAVLEQIADLKTTVARIRAGIRRLSESAGRLPANDADIGEFVGEAQKITEEWNSLDTEHLSSEVIQFVREAGSLTGARLSSLTPAVSDWLTNKGLAESFRVRAVVSSSARPF